MTTEPLPPLAELQALPILTPRQTMDYFAGKNGKGESPGRVLIELSDFIEMLSAIAGFELNRRVLLSYSAPRIKLIDPPIQKDGKACYVYPDHFNRMAMILTLRQAYNLPLAAIRDILEHFPAKNRDLILDRKFGTEELLDLAKMLKSGYELRDLVMAKGCDVLLQDMLSSTQSVMAAMEPGDHMRRLQEKLILERLEEMMTWVRSGRWHEFLRRESAQDLKDLRTKALLNKKMVNKVLARRARLDKKGQALF